MKQFSAQSVIRVIFYAAMPIFLIAGLYSGLRLWYGLFFIELFTLMLILAIDIWTVVTFGYKQTLTVSQAEKGETAAVELTIVNEKPIPLSMMEIEMETVSPDDRTTLRMSLTPFSRASFTVPMTLPYRGVYEVGMTKVHITDFFGLLPFQFDMRILPYYRLPKITVYPRAERIGTPAGLPRDSKSLLVRNRSLLAGGEAPISAREYRPGDPMRRIHWAKTAQMGSLYTREYEPPGRESLLILLDNRVADPDSETGRMTMDVLCEAAADLALFGVNAGYPVKVQAAASAPGRPDHAEAAELRTFPDIHSMLACAASVELPGRKIEKRSGRWKKKIAQEFEVDHLALSEKMLGLVQEAIAADLLDSYLFVLTANPDRALISELIGLERTLPGVSLIQAGEGIPTDGLHTLVLTPGEPVRERLEAI